MAKRKKQAKQHKRQASKRKQTVTLDISAMAHGGHGIGKLRGKAVFIPYTLPGETVSAEISGGRGAALFGRGPALNRGIGRPRPAAVPAFWPRALLGLPMAAYRLSRAALTQARCIG